MERRRNGAMGLWKLIFSMVVVIHYAYLMRPKAAGKYPLFFNRGELAIDFFFVLAGVMLARHMGDLPKDKPFDWMEMWTYIKGIMRRYLPALFLIWVATCIAVNAAYCKDTDALFNNILGAALELLPIRAAGFNIKSLDANTFVGYRVMDQAWVFSAVIVALVILYPLYRRNRERFERYIAPVGAILTLGYVFFKTNNLTADNVRTLDGTFFFYTFKSTFTVIGEICLGVACYAAAGSLREKKLKKDKALWITFIEIVCFLLALLYMNYDKYFPEYTDLPAVLLMAVGIVLCDSKQGAFSSRLDNKLCDALGRFSLYPYLTFMVFAKTLPLLMPDAGTLRMEVVYFGLTIASAILLTALEKPFVSLLKASKRLFVRPVPGSEKESI